MPRIENQPALKLNRQARNFNGTTKKNGSADFGKFLETVGGIAAPLLQTAASMAGGPGAGNLVGGLLGGGTLGGLGGGGLTGGASEQMQLLALQQQIQRQTQIFETLTNISKAEHDARMSSVRNMRP